MLLVVVVELYRVLLNEHIGRSIVQGQLALTLSGIFLGSVFVGLPSTNYRGRLWVVDQTRSCLGCCSDIVTAHLRVYIVEGEVLRLGILHVDVTPTELVLLLGVPMLVVVLKLEKMSSLFRDDSLPKEVCSLL